MNAQEVFNTVAKHLLTMPHQAVKNYENQACAYRGFDEVPCAAGKLFTDAETLIPQWWKNNLDPDSELQDAETIDDLPETSVTDLHNEGLLPERLVPHIALLMELQNLHDSKHVWSANGNGPCYPEPMKEALRAVAGLHELNTAVLQ